MKDLVKEKQEFKIIPENIEGATVCVAQKLEGEKIAFKLLKADFKDFSAGGEVELFSFVSTGILYFKAKINELKEDLIWVEISSPAQILQRRQYSRVVFNKEILLQEVVNKAEIKAFSLDISAGGMKLTCDVPLDVSKDYQIGIEVYNTVVKCIFKPIRIEEASEEGLLKYTVSGRFKNIESLDRITLVQYCFKTQMEADSKRNK